MNYKPYDFKSTFSASSRRNLDTCHLKLQTLFSFVASDGWDMTIICGHREEAAQNQAFASGASLAEWPDSNHNESPSLAIDVAPYIPGIGIPWNENFDPLPWHMLSGVVQTKARSLGIKIRWGGYFKSIKDLPHWELDL